jgi:hypothetical protein
MSRGSPLEDEFSENFRKEYGRISYHNIADKLGVSYQTVHNIFTERNKVITDRTRRLLEEFVDGYEVIDCPASEGLWKLAVRPAKTREGSSKIKATIYAKTTK